MRLGRSHRGLMTTTNTFMMMTKSTSGILSSQLGVVSKRGRPTIWNPSFNCSSVPRLSSFSTIPKEDDGNISSSPPRSLLDVPPFPFPSSSSSFDPKTKAVKAVKTSCKTSPSTPTAFDSGSLPTSTASLSTNPDIFTSESAGSIYVGLSPPAAPLESGRPPMSIDEEVAFRTEKIKEIKAKVYNMQEEIELLRSEKKTLSEALFQQTSRLKGRRLENTEKATISDEESSRISRRLDDIAEAKDNMEKEKRRLGAAVDNHEANLKELERRRGRDVSKSFGEYLGTFFDLNNLRNEEVLMPSSMPNLDRQGLDECIGQALHSIKNSEYLRRRFKQAPTFNYVHASPGGGKTYFLRELSRKLERDCNKYGTGKSAYFDDVEFVGISYSSPTPIKADLKYLSVISRDSNICKSSLTVLARIYFCLFTKNTLNWRAFTKLLKFHLLFDPENAESFQDELESLIHHRFNNRGKKLVLLFDDSTSIDAEIVYCEDPLYRKASADVQSFVISEAERTNLFCYYFFSIPKLDESMLAEGTFLKFRLCESVGALDRLTQYHTDNLFKDAVSTLDLTDVEERERAGAGAVEASLGGGSYILRNLHYLSGGHPGTVDFLISEISGLQAKTPLLHVITQILSGSKLESPAWNIILAVLLGERVDVEKTFPDSKKTFNDAIANGELVGSLKRTNAKIYPQVPEILLHKWAHDNHTSEPGTIQSEIAIELKKILDVRFNYSAVSVAEILAGREYIRSRINGSPSYRKGYSRISLKELYPFPEPERDGRSRMDIKVNASKLLMYSDEETIPSPLNNVIYKPEFPKNRKALGYDFRIRFSLASSVTNSETNSAAVSVGTFLDVYYVVDCSEANELTRSAVKLKNRYKKCASLGAHPQSAGFVVVIMTWGDGATNKKFYEKFGYHQNCHILQKESMQRTLGPNFSNFVETLCGGPESLPIANKVAETFWRHRIDYYNREKKVSYDVFVERFEDYFNGGKQMSEAARNRVIRHIDIPNAAGHGDGNISYIEWKRFFRSIFADNKTDFSPSFNVIGYIENSLK